MSEEVIEQTQQAIELVQAKLSSLDKRLRQNRRQRRDVELAPVPTDELPQRVERDIQLRAEAWSENHKYQLLQDGPRGAGIATYRLKRRPYLPDLGSFDALCVASPETAKAYALSILTKVNTAPGLPSAQRPQETARLDAEHAELLSQREQIVDNAIGLGIPLKHLPETLRRRGNEAARVEREIEEVPDRARREAALEEEHLRRTAPESAEATVSQSSYLQANKLRRERY